jgi:hypothetical protein
VVTRKLEAGSLAARARSTTPSEPTPAPPPYDPLPVLGHVSVYTLNLILLRTYLADETHTFDEPALDAGDRPWDRLVGLWRSWFTPESLDAMAAQFTATRTETRLILEPTRATLIIKPESPLDTAYNAAIALADNLTAESMGLHVAALAETTPDEFLPELLKRFNDETRPLALIANSMLRRLDGYDPKLPAAVRIEFNYLGPHTSELVLSFVEFADRAVLAPRQRIEISAPRSLLMDMMPLSRYASAVITHLYADLDTDWLQNLLSDPSGSFGVVFNENLTTVWGEFLQSPAAAPVLRAAVARLSATECAQVANEMQGMVPAQGDPQSRLPRSGLIWPLGGLPGWHAVALGSEAAVTAFPSLPVTARAGASGPGAAAFFYGP